MSRRVNVVEDKGLKGISLSVNVGKDKGTSPGVNVVREG